jgi:hypothetical protein
MRGISDHLTARRTACSHKAVGLDRLALLQSSRKTVDVDSRGTIDALRIELTISGRERLPALASRAQHRRRARFVGRLSPA